MQCPVDPGIAELDLQRHGDFMVVSGKSEGKFVKAIRDGRGGEPWVHLLKACHVHLHRPYATPLSGNTLCGFSSQSGSNAPLIRRCCSSSCAANCTGIRSRFSTPTPCSPVRQPPTSTHNFKISAPNCSAR